MPGSGVRCGRRRKHDQRDRPNRGTAPDADAPGPRVARRAGQVRGPRGDRLRPERRQQREHHPGHVTLGRVSNGAADGDTVIVTFAMDPSAGAVSCADSGGNSYSLDADVTNGSGTSGVRTVIFSAFINTALGNQDTITVTHPLATSKAVSVNEFSGLRASALDRTASATGNDTTPATSATAVTTQPDELLLGAVGVETKKTESFTPGAGYTALTASSSGPALGASTDNVTIDPEYQIVTATGSYAAGGTLGRVRLWAAAIATYRSMCGDGTLDPGEQCDDGNNLNADCCSASCTIEPAGTVCRPAAGVCDVAETCNGASPTCPADVFVSAATQCRAAAG